MMTLDQDIVIGCAFRYALGRQTYVVSSVCDEIERLVNEIPIKTRRRIVIEINEAIWSGNAGMDIDIQRWRQCRSAIEKSLPEMKGRPYA